MEADSANVPLGKFVMITSNVEDPDNAKLYVRTDEVASGFSFITDFSGAQGIQGQQGPAGQDGANGTDGQDGITPIVTVTNISNGHNVAFSYGTGDSRNTNFDVMDGNNANQLQADWN